MKFVGAMKMSDFDTWAKVDCEKIGASLMSNNADTAAEWCSSYNSDGFYSFGGNAVWFSKSEDAVIFALMWTR